MYDNSLVTHTDYSLALCYLYLLLARAVLLILLARAVLHYRSNIGTFRWQLILCSKHIRLGIWFSIITNAILLKYVHRIFYFKLLLKTTNMN